ncbi:hypothetical protein ALT785_160310 [Alteromonas infernus]
MFGRLLRNKTLTFEATAACSHKNGRRRTISLQPQLHVTVHGAGAHY